MYRAPDLGSQCSYMLRFSAYVCMCIQTHTYVYLCVCRCVLCISLPLEFNLYSLRLACCWADPGICSGDLSDGGHLGKSVTGTGSHMCGV